MNISKIAELLVDEFPELPKYWPAGADDQERVEGLVKACAVSQGLFVFTEGLDITGLMLLMPMRADRAAKLNLDGRPGNPNGDVLQIIAVCAAGAEELGILHRQLREDIAASRLIDRPISVFRNGEFIQIPGVSELTPVEPHTHPLDDLEAVVGSGVVVSNDSGAIVHEAAPGSAGIYYFQYSRSLGGTSTFGYINALSAIIHWDNVLSKPAIALVGHTHVRADITDFAHTHTKSEIVDFAHTHVRADITDFSHTHTKSEIVDFAHTHTKSEIIDFAHTHVRADITDFAHTHTKSEIVDFAHTHVRADITDFAHTHTKSEISDFAHTHVRADITDFAHGHPLSDLSGVSGNAAIIATALDTVTSLPVPPGEGEYVVHASRDSLGNVTWSFHSESTLAPVIDFDDLVGTLPTHEHIATDDIKGGAYKIFYTDGAGNTLELAKPGSDGDWVLQASVSLGTPVFSWIDKSTIGSAPAQYHYESLFLDRENDPTPLDNWALPAFGGHVNGRFNGYAPIGALESPTHDFDDKGEYTMTPAPFDGAVAEIMITNMLNDPDPGFSDSGEVTIKIVKATGNDPYDITGATSNTVIATFASGVLSRLSSNSLTFSTGNTFNKGDLVWVLGEQAGGETQRIPWRISIKYEIT